MSFLEAVGRVAVALIFLLVLLPVTASVVTTAIYDALSKARIKWARRREEAAKTEFHWPTGKQ